MNKEKTLESLTKLEEVINLLSVDERFLTEAHDLCKISLDILLKLRTKVEENNNESKQSY